jgi:bifunctional oligoribonuclease and PAP phosphatase NrnA
MVGSHPFCFPSSSETTVQELFNQLDRILQRGTSFVLTTHIGPDGDGLGSEVALALYLKSLNKKTAILNHSPLPPFYDFLNVDGVIAQYNDAVHRSLVASADVIMVVDTNHPDRVADIKGPILESKATKVIIDHHLDPDPFATLSVIDDHSAATGEIVFRFLSSHQGFKFSREIATALYTAIMTDTGSFRFPKTDGDLHRAVATLIDAGADPVRIYQEVYERATPGRLHLLGRTLDSLATTHDGQVAYLTIPRSAFLETGTTETDADKFAPYALSVAGVRIGLMFTELDGVIKISFRSKGDISINKLAREFGGNGHKNAAGARISNGTLSDIVSRVLDRAKRYL